MKVDGFKWTPLVSAYGSNHLLVASFLQEGHLGRDVLTESTKFCSITPLRWTLCLTATGLDL